MTTTKYAQVCNGNQVSDAKLRAHFAGQLLALTGHPVPDDCGLDLVLATMDRLVNDPDFVPAPRFEDGTTPCAGEEFHTVTEADHAAHRSEVTNKSTADKPCKRVWIIAEDMLAANPDVKRKDVIAACVEAGVAFYTARTQYQQWLGVRKEMAERENSKG